MPSIHLTTFIAAPIERVFDLSRHLAIYKIVFHNRKQKFPSGAAANLIGKGETMTIVGKAAWKTRMAMFRMSSVERPSLFTEDLVKGDLEAYHHEHHFKSIQNGTIVIDIVEFGFPKDLPGKLMAKVSLKKNVEEFITKKNEMIRSYAETEKWRAILT